MSWGIWRIYEWGNRPECSPGRNSPLLKLFSFFLCTSQCFPFWRRKSKPDCNPRVLAVRAHFMCQCTSLNLDSPCVIWISQKSISSACKVNLATLHMSVESKAEVPTSAQHQSWNGLLVHKWCTKTPEWRKKVIFRQKATPLSSGSSAPPSLTRLPFSSAWAGGFRTQMGRGRGQGWTEDTGRGSRGQGWPLLRSPPVSKWPPVYTEWRQ